MDCDEALSSCLLDTNCAITVHTLCAKAHVDIETAKHACLQFLNGVNSSQNVVPVTVQIEKPDLMTYDPRERIITLNRKKIADAREIEIYGLLPTHMTDQDSHTHANNCLYEERHFRNACFAQANMETDSALEYFHSSNITCSSITKKDPRAKTPVNDPAEEPNVARCMKQSQPPTRATLPKVKSETKKSTSKKVKDSNVKPAGNTAIKNTTEKQNVLSVDPSSEESDDDIGFKFVPKKTGRKRVVEEDDDDMEGSEMAVAALPEEKKAKVETNAPIPIENHSVDSAKESVVEKHRKLVTKTRINEDGYMVTEKCYESVDGQETENSDKRQLKEKPVSRQQGNTKSKKTSAGTGKQKTLLSFFQKN